MAQPSISEPPRRDRPRPDALPGLSVVMVCRDDEHSVADAVRHAAAAAAATSLDYEIIAVDDGSTDRTPEVLAAVVASEPRLRVLLHAHARGRTATLQTAVAASRMPWVLLLDAGDELDLDHFEDFVALAARHDLLVGRRVMRRGPLAARAFDAARSRAASQVVGVQIHDIDCPLKLVRRELLDGLFASSGWTSVGLELALTARAHDARVVEVNVRQRHGVSGTAPSPFPSARELRRLLALSFPPKEA